MSYKFSESFHGDADNLYHRGVYGEDGISAIIKLPRAERPSVRALAQLRHEYSLLRSLRLPGVPVARALVRHGEDSLALICEDIPGQPLSQLIARQKLGWVQALRIGSAVAGILAKLHQRRIIHQGVRPASIFSDGSGQRVHLIDFRAASRLGVEAASAGEVGLDPERLAYMSPEQTGRMNRVVDSRTDLYSLGITLYELLTGVVPFQSADPIELVHSHLARRPAPPHELLAELPESVSTILLKLLAKAPEDRYQTARGLKADLDECLQQAASGQQAQVFPLARSDHDGQLRASQRLYGREAETETLMAAFERVGRGACELVLVSGYSGVGKSVLVHEISKPIAIRGGYFIGGKFDQYNRNIPYDSLVQAFRELVRLILAEKAETLAAWKVKLEAAVAPNGELLTDLIPELELIIGRQPSVPTLGPTESQNRFRLVLQNFVRALATAQHPLVIFLDDLQWIDSASLKVLEAVLTDPERAHLLVIGAYRDNEVDSAHLLALALDVLKKTDLVLHEIRLAPLEVGSVNAMLADMLSQSEEQLAPLAAVVHKKTSGNPFFVSQFVASLHAERLLTFDEPSGRWQWDLGAIQDRMVTDNVVFFLTAKLKQLPAETQRVLHLAAAIGHRFDCKTLATVLEKSLAETGALLWPALEGGFLWPLHGDYQFLYPGEAGATENHAETGAQVAFKFLHDRVQQAAYALGPQDQRAQLHLRIGRLMLASRLPPGPSDQLLDITKHLNLGVQLMTVESERLELAQLNLQAGRRAKASSAPEAAASYFGAGLAALAPPDWEHHPDLWFSLASEYAECESLNGRFAQVDTTLGELLGRSRTSVEYAQACSLRMLACGMQGQHGEAMAYGYRALQRLGITLPEDPQEVAAAFAAELAASEKYLGQRRIADLVSEEVVSDPAINLALKLLNLMATAAYLVAPQSYGLIILKQVNVSLQHGNSNTSAYGFVSYGLILISFLGQYEKGREFGQLALALNDKFNNVLLTGQIHAVYAMSLHFSAPLRQSIDSYGRAYRAGLEVGDFIWLSYSCFSIILLRLNLGDDLQEVAAEVSWFLKMANRTKDATAAPQLLLCRQVIECLQGRTRDRCSLSDASFDEEQFRIEQEESRVAPNVCRYYLNKLQLLYLYGDYDGALAAAAEIDKRADSITGLYEKCSYIFYKGLTLFARAAALPAAERSQHSELLTSYQESLAAWAEQCPANYAHKLALFRAEAAALAGMPDAGPLYEEAIREAVASDFKREQALTWERAAKYYLALGQLESAAARMQSARHAYLRWGATAKVADLDATYAQLLQREPTPPRGVPMAESPAVEPGRAATDSTLDLSTVLRVAQALASQIVLDQVLEQILQAVVTNSGAQRGCLVLERGGTLFIEAMLGPEGAVRTKLALPVETSTELATSVVQYVARTHETVVLADASGRNSFVSDPYIVAQKPRSLLCLALMHQGRLAGILYLENNLAANVFTESRVELLRLLSSHAAVSVQNALLYSELNALTEQLRVKNRELSETNTQLQRELVERARAEQERLQAQQAQAALREEIITAQRVRLAELSTPLIPITDQIMVMPIIGTVDEQRAQQVVEAALAGAQAHRTTTVIIDITGIKHIDTHVARTLMQAASALRLLGTQAVLTGIRSEVAQTLIRLGIDLGSIVTLGTLQSGIAYALNRTAQSSRSQESGAERLSRKLPKKD